MSINVPEGKRIISIDTSANQNTSVFEDIPVSELDNLKQQVADLQNYIIEKEYLETTTL